VGGGGGVYATLLDRGIGGKLGVSEGADWESSADAVDNAAAAADDDDDPLSALAAVAPPLPPTTPKPVSGSV
jgi:hypothetical protein